MCDYYIVLSIAFLVQRTFVDGISEDCEGYDYCVDCPGKCDEKNRISDICNSITRGCFCKPGYAGQDCSKDCDPGRYGAGCKKTCNCDKEMKCDKVYGCNDDDISSEQVGSSEVFGGKSGTNGNMHTVLTLSWSQSRPSSTTPVFLPTEKQQNSPRIDVSPTYDPHVDLSSQSKPQSTELLAPQNTPSTDMSAGTNIIITVAIVVSVCIGILLFTCVSCLLSRKTLQKGKVNEEIHSNISEARLLSNNRLSRQGDMESYSRINEPIQITTNGRQGVRHVYDYIQVELNDGVKSQPYTTHTEHYTEIPDEQLGHTDHVSLSPSYMSPKDFKVDTVFQIPNRYNSGGVYNILKFNNKGARNDVNYDHTTPNNKLYNGLDFTYR